MSKRRSKHAHAPAAVRARRRANFEQLENRVLFAIATADLLVSVDATGLTPGQVTNVPNTGSLGGVFQATSGGDTVPVIGRPDATATSGTNGIRFDGTDFLQLVNAADSTLITAPEGLTGADPTTSIEAWVWNPGVNNEETMVAWGLRNGPDGSNMSFNYGSNPDYGAVGHWGSPDIGWGPTVPAGKQWHYLAYTYDGDITRVYIDGQLANTEDLTDRPLDIHTDTAINLATQLEPDGSATVPLRGTLTLGRVRINDGTLTDAQILNNYNFEKADFVEPVIPPPVIKPASLLVSVDATTLPEGDATDVPATGPLAGFFEAVGGGDTVPVIGKPVATAIGGTSGIVFDGNDYLQLVSSAGGELTRAPASITGADPQTSIETWVWNPSVPAEETMVAWGFRNGPDGSNYSFNYGDNGAWGAVGHWGSPDIGYNDAGGAPAARHWHHLVTTFDGDTTRVYADGVLVNSEVLGPGSLNIHANTAINLATQLENETDPTVPLRGSLTLGKVRIYEGVLTDAQVAANYNNEKGQFVEPIFPPPPPAHLQVSIDATTLPEGPANDIPNTGPLGGVFEATGGGTTVPVIGQPIEGGTGGTRGIRMDGTDFLQLVDGPNGSIITAPAEITGVDPKQSIEAWVFNPGIAGEETIASWGRRGGPDGTNMSFNYGSNGAWGAVGRWGVGDIGWDPSGATPHAPAANQWHHLAYTYDGLTSHVYVDGVLVNTESLDPGVINTFPDTPINIGTQLEPDATTPTHDLRGSLTVGKLRIYDGVLTDAQVAANFNNEKASFVNPTPPAATPLSEAPIHRYTFNNAAGAAPTGTTIADTGSVGGQAATVLGDGATFNGTRLVLPGGSSATAAYVDLPNGILSNLGAANGGSGQVTFEGWVKNTGNQSWSRYYDFGSGTGATEQTGPGGTANGEDFFMLTAQTGGDPIHRFEATDNDDGDPTGNKWDEVTSPANQDLHFAVTWNEATGRVTYYENGHQVAGYDSPLLINAINDINNWLGRSQFTADANLQGEYDEFRIYDKALTPGEVLGDFQAGADVVNIGGAPAVSQVFVNGPGITGQATPNGIAFRTLAGVDNTYGYPMPTGTSQLKAIPWSNGINKIAIRFTQDVASTLGQDDLVVHGVNTANYAISGFTYDAATKTGVWTLTNPIVNDKVNLFLDDALVTGLDGEFTTGQAFPSGNGAANGDFTYRLNVLRGDANQDGAVNALDLGQLKAKLNRTATNPGAGATGYSVFADLNADGQINALDLGIAKARLNTKLPNLEPTATSLLFSSRPISA
jgi:hypothetical protein